MAYSQSFSGRQGAITYTYGASTIELPMTEWTVTHSTDAIDGTNFTSRYPTLFGPFNEFGDGAYFEEGEGSVASQEVAPGYNKLNIEARGYPSCEEGVPGGESVIPLPLIGERVVFTVYPMVGNPDLGTVSWAYYARINSVNYSLNVRGVLEYTITASNAGPPPLPAAAANVSAADGEENLTYAQRLKKRRDAVVKPWSPPQSKLKPIAPPPDFKPIKPVPVPPDPVPPAPVPPTPPEPEPEAP